MGSWRSGFNKRAFLFERNLVAENATERILKVIGEPKEGRRKGHRRGDWRDFLFRKEGKKTALINLII